MNINSISELSNISATTVVPAAVRTLSAASTDNKGVYSEDIVKDNFKGIATALLGSQAQVSSLNSGLNFNTLSCDSMFVEVSHKDGSNYKSYKFDLGQALTDIAKTLAWVAALNMNALTEARAREIFFPYSGNMSDNAPAVSGIKLTTHNNGNTDLNALSIMYGSVTVSRGNNIYFKVTPNVAASAPQVQLYNVLLTGNAGTTVDVHNLTANTAKITNNISATNLSANSLKAGLYNSTMWNMQQGNNNDGLSVIKLTADTSENNILRANSLCAGLTSDNYILSAEKNLSTLSVISLYSKGKITAKTDITADGTITGKNIYATADLTGNTIIAGEDITAAGDITTDNGTIAGKALKATHTLSAGIDPNNNVNLNVQRTGTITINSLNAGTLHAGGTNYGLLQANSGADSITINNVYVTSLLSGGTLKGDSLFGGKLGESFTLNVPASNDTITIGKLNVNGNNGLTAAGVSHLTAQAALWS